MKPIKTIAPGTIPLRRGSFSAYYMDPEDGDLFIEGMYYTPADVRKLREVCNRYLAVTEVNKKAAALAKKKAKAAAYRKARAAGTKAKKR